MPLDVIQQLNSEAENIKSINTLLESFENEYKEKLEPLLYMYEIAQNKNTFKVNKAILSKYIRSQNGSKLNYPYVKANGTIKLLPQDIEFKNFNIKTHEQTNSKIFNILLRTMKKISLS